MENVTKEFERRRDALLAHVEGDENWEPLGGDPDFHPPEFAFNPYTPMSMLSKVAELAWTLANAPRTSPVEALIESMVTSGSVEPVEAACP